MEKQGFTFNTVGFHILGIPPYFFCCVCGFVIAICCFMILVYIKHYQLQKQITIISISIVGMVVFARVFGCVSGIYRALGAGKPITFLTIKNTGIVFYGGLFGLLLTYSLCSRLMSDPREKNGIDILAVCIPLFHSITRIGCFLSGCCYGIEYNGFGSIYYGRLEENQIVFANRIPVQLFEAFFNFLLFFYLLYFLLSSNWIEKSIIRRYLVIYSFGRFLLEFVRGDITRGVIMGISFSQSISVFIWVYLGLTTLQRIYINKRRQVHL